MLVIRASTVLCAPWVVRGRTMECVRVCPVLTTVCACAARDTWRWPSEQAMEQTLARTPAVTCVRAVYSCTVTNCTAVELQTYGGY